MKWLSYSDFSGIWRKGSTIFLALSFFLGHIFGMAAFRFADDSIFTLMRSTIYGSVSIISLLSVTVLPFLISAFAVYISSPALLLIVSFGKAFFTGFISFGICNCFGDAGWLFRLLLMFPDVFLLPVLYLFWLRHISRDRKISFLELFVLLTLVLFIGSIYFCYVSPLLIWLIHL